MISPKLKALIQAVVDSTSNEGCSGDLVVAGQVEIDALAAYVAPMSQKDFINSAGQECPFCRSDDLEFDGDVRLNMDKCYNDCRCFACDKGWIETYTLTGYECE